MTASQWSLRDSLPGGTLPVHATYNSSVPCVCDPEFVDGHRFNQWIGSFFGDCVYSSQDMASWSFGMLSLCIWIVVFLPQLHLNFERKSVEGLSLGLLILWTFGDVANLAGTYLANQLPPQRVTAIYFLITDFLILLQWLYYDKFLAMFAETELEYGVRPQRKPNVDDDLLRADTGASGPSGGSNFSRSSGNSVTYVPAEGEPDERAALLSSPLRREVSGQEDLEPSPKKKRGSTSSAGGSSVSSAKGRRKSLKGNSLGYNTPALSGGLHFIVMSVSIALLAFGASGSPISPSFEIAAPMPAICNAQRPVTDLPRPLGYVCAWISGLFYVVSRLPQIWENASNQSVEGLSIPMFFLTVFGNVAYGMGILLRMPTVDGAFWLGTFPYIVGSFGTISFDVVILFQAWKYGMAATEEGTAADKEENGDMAN